MAGNLLTMPDNHPRTTRQTAKQQTSPHTHNVAVTYHRCSVNHPGAIRPRRGSEFGTDKT